MKHHLTAIRVAVDDQAVTPLGDSLVGGELLRDQNHVPHQRRIFFIEVVDRRNELIGDNKNVRRRNRIDIPESSDALVLVNMSACASPLMIFEKIVDMRSLPDLLFIEYAKFLLKFLIYGAQIHRIISTF